MYCSHPWVNESDTDTDTDTPQNRGERCTTRSKACPQTLINGGRGSGNETAPGVARIEACLRVVSITLSICRFRSPTLRFVLSGKRRKRRICISHLVSVSVSVSDLFTHG